ncbi:hypothetical protein [Paraburkholderia sp. J8-2]|uniref:hypothetical protein n=1 Tax=Paraburkholderia sp. J8-2 TaxID=2805440 RepID=UPI002AB7527A|nr:hypothetical protein [Paraburkholderia sp. J8-2]
MVKNVVVGIVSRGAGWLVLADRRAVLVTLLTARAAEKLWLDTLVSTFRVKSAGGSSTLDYRKRRSEDREQQQANGGQNHPEVPDQPNQAERRRLLRSV